MCANRLATIDKNTVLCYTNAHEMIDPQYGDFLIKGSPPNIKTNLCF